MKPEEVKKVIQSVPLGSKIEVVKKNGNAIQVALKSYEIAGSEPKDFNGITIPEVPAALLVAGPIFGDLRLEIADLARIATVAV